MTQDQYNIILLELEKWRRERHLTPRGQVKGVIGNLLEEMAEFERGVNVTEKIDALCDMAVFMLNAFNRPYNLSFSESLRGDFSDIMHSLHKVYDYVHQNDGEWSLDWFISAIFANIRKLGFDDYKCMLETIKEISSRTGEYDPQLKKWIKDVSKEAMAKWYMAQYKNCKK